MFSLELMPCSIPCIHVSDLTLTLFARQVVNKIQSPQRMLRVSEEFPVGQEIDNTTTHVITAVATAEDIAS